VTDRERARERIVKLLALGQQTNPEGRAARAKAKELADKYGFTIKWRRRPPVRHPPAPDGLDRFDQFMTLWVEHVTPAWLTFFTCFFIANLSPVGCPA